MRRWPRHRGYSLGKPHGKGLRESRLDYSSVARATAGTSGIEDSRETHKPRRVPECPRNYDVSARKPDGLCRLVLAAGKCWRCSLPQGGYVLPGPGARCPNGKQVRIPQVGETVNRGRNCLSRSVALGPVSG